MGIPHIRTSYLSNKVFARWRGTPYAVSHIIHILISNAFPCLVNVPLDFLCQVNTVFFGKCFTFNRHRRSSSSGLIARIQMKKDKHFKVCWIYILRFIRISRVVVTLMVFISWILFSGVLSYGFQASRNYIWQEISKLQWVESDCSSRSSLWCCCIRTIRSFSRRRRVLNAVQTDWKPRRFQWNQQGSLQVALFVVSYSKCYHQGLLRGGLLRVFWAKICWGIREIEEMHASLGSSSQLIRV